MLHVTSPYLPFPANSVHPFSCNEQYQWNKKRPPCCLLMVYDLLHVQYMFFGCLLFPRRGWHWDGWVRCGINSWASCHWLLYFSLGSARHRFFIRILRVFSAFHVSVLLRYSAVILNVFYSWHRYFVAFPSFPAISALSSGTGRSYTWACDS